MSSGEDYLEALLRAATTPDAETPKNITTPSTISATEEPVIEEPVIEEPVIEEPVIEESMFEGPVIEEPVIEGPVIEEPVIEEPVIEEPVIEEPVIEEPVIEEPVIEEPVIEEPVIEEPVIEEPVIEEPVVEDAIIEAPIMDEPASDVEPAAEGDEDVLQDEDISNLLASLSALDAIPQPAIQPAEGQEIAISPEELQRMADDLDIKDITPEPEQEEDTDVTELLDQLSNDSELDEINELLKKNDNNETVEEDDILAMLENATEGDSNGNGLDDEFAIEEPLADDEGDEESEAGSKREQKKREKKEKKAKKEKIDQADKKPGFFARLFNSLTEEVMSEESAEEVKDLFGEATIAETLESNDAANQELLEELDEEDQKKGKKGKKGKKEKTKKEKPVKEKKPKKIKEPKQEKRSEKKLPTKHVTVIAVMCASIGLLMIAIAIFYPYYTDMKKAADHYQEQDYEMAYECFLGHHLNAEEQTLFDKTILMLRLDRKYQSYLNYTSLGMKLEAFNALIQGQEAVDKYREDAELLGIMEEYESKARMIEEALNNQYGANIEQVRQWIAIEDPQLYSRTIADFLNGTNTSEDGNQAPEEPPENPIIEGEEGEFTGEEL